jgi:putative hydrolase of the HAD superfamily
VSTVSGLPKAVLLDLDDTILDDTGKVDGCWREACQSHAGGGGIDAEALRAAIERASKWFWSDAERHRVGRLDLDAARRHVVRLALETMGIVNDQLAALVGDTYSRLREEGIEPLSDAIDVVRWLRRRGCKLALLTNGSGPAQRRKIDRFELAPLFDEILIEGEVGFGKPDRRVYVLALERLGVGAADAWMVGDNLVWDVEQPQRLGIFAVWIDRDGTGVRGDAGVQPDLIVRGLSELRQLDGEPVRS